MNCFQFCIFAVWNTTFKVIAERSLMLWIAFNFVSLQCETQHLSCGYHHPHSCELLSILYLCSVKHNYETKNLVRSLVVNCFQFCIFAVWNTTTGLAKREITSCELLSILYLCSVKHNMINSVDNTEIVVNCFQFCIFAVWNTTGKAYYRLI